MRSEMTGSEELNKQLEEFKEKARFYKRIADSAINIEIFLDSKGKIVYINNVFEQISGYKCEDLLNGTITAQDIVHPEDWKLTTALINNTNYKKPINDINFRIIRSDKKVRHINLCVLPVYENNEFVGTRASASDISKQKDFNQSQILNKKLQKQNEQYLLVNNEYLAINEEYATLNEEYKTTIEDLQEAKQKTEESEKKYRRLFTSMQEGMYLHDIITDEKGQAVNYRIIEANPISEKYLNIKPEIAIGKTATELFQTSEAPLLDIYANVAKTGEPHTFEQYFEPMDKWFHISVFSPGKDKFATVFLDISETKKYEKELIAEKERAEESEEKHRFLFENMTQGVVYYNAQGQIIYANEAASKILGLSIEQLQGKTTHDFQWQLIHEDGSVYERESHPFELTLKSGQAIKNSIMGVLNPNTNQYKWININSIPKCKKGQKKPFEVIITFEDITEIRNAKRKLESSEFRLKEAQNMAKIGHWDLDLVQNKLYWSDEIYRIFGCIPQEFDATYEAFLEYVHPDDKMLVNDAYKTHLETGEEYNIIHRIQLADKTIKYINERCKSECNENNTPIRSVGTIADLTETIRTQNELKIAKEKAEDSDRLKTMFLNNMSHEIRTPLNGILGFTGFLSSDDITPEKRRYYVNIVQNSGKQLVRIIDDILEISRLETKQVKAILEEVCINDLLLELFSIFDMDAKNHRIPLYLKKNISNQASVINTDRTKLHKIISNLLENSFKFTDTGFVELGNYIEEGYLVMYVKDTGIGIEPKKQKYIFNRFTQVEKEISQKVGGLGLGLSIAKENTELLGGELTVESESDKGTSFFIKIPYQPARPIEKAKQHQHESKQENKTLHILIAEDEEINYLYLETIILEKLKIKCTIFHAQNGTEAVEICKESKIDLILMDLKMPYMNGFEATKLIKQMGPNIPIVAQTAYSTTDEKEKAMIAGCDDFVSKPINIEELTQKLMKYIDI